MRTLNAEEIQKLDKGEVIPSIHGTIKNVYQRKSGTSEKGDWSVQDVVISLDGEPMKIKFWNHDDLQPITGKEVTVRAFEGKTGLTSLFAEDDTFKGNTTRVIRATAAAKIVVGLNGEPVTHLGETETDFIPMTHNAKGEATTGVDEARHHIQRAVNLYVLCVDAVDAVIKPHVQGMTAELYQAAIGTLFIEASRAGFVEKMPDKPIQK